MSLLATLSQEYRANSPIDGNEYRMTSMGITNEYRAQTDAANSIVSPDLKQKAMMSAGRATKISVMDFQALTLRTTRPLTIPVFQNNSAFVTLTWTTVAFGFPMYTAEHFNNDVDYQRDFNKKYEAMLKAFGKRLEDLGAANLNTNKGLLINGAASGTTLGGHTLAAGVTTETISDLANSQIYADIPAMMGQNDFYDTDLTILGNQGLHAILRRLNGFGENNSENKRIQFQNNNFGFSNSITDGASRVATGYAVNPGQLGMLFRAEPDSILGTKLSNGTSWDMVRLPLIDIPCGVYQYEGGVDISANGAHVSHLTRTGQHVFDFAFDVCHLTAYNSDTATIPSGILKFDINKT